MRMLVIVVSLAWVRVAELNRTAMLVGIGTKSRTTTDVLDVEAERVLKATSVCMGNLARVVVKERILGDVTVRTPASVLDEVADLSLSEEIDRTLTSVRDVVGALMRTEVTVSPCCLRQVCQRLDCPQARTARKIEPQSSCGHLFSCTSPVV